MKFSIAILLHAALCLAASAAELTPYSLECEARKNPVGIDAAQPRLSWKLKSTQPGQKQTGYQIVVSTETAQLWDSGRVNSAETTWISYEGKPLASFQRYWWKLRIWDAYGNPSPWSEPSQWTMAILDPALWKGGWLSETSNALLPGPLPIFRKQITVDRPIKRALAFVAGLGFHELRLNGEKVGDHVLSPAWSNFHNTVYYETFDLTRQLKQGSNAFGVLLGNGLYNVVGGRYAKFTASFGAPRFRFLLRLEFADGSASDLPGDSSWRAHAGPITFSCFYGGEDFDARAEPEGWDRPGFDDSAWDHASGVEPPGGQLRAQSSPAVRVHETFRPIKVTEPKPGIFVYDLGQNFAGWPKIVVSGAAGAQVRLTPGELLDASGLVSQESSGGPNYFNYTLKGSGRETWSPRFSYYGFRYVQVEAHGAVVHALEGQFIYLDATRAGAFSSSNELLNRIHRLIDAAIRSNLNHSLTDCPHREKLGWLEEAYLMGPSLLYNWDLRTFLPKQARDIREARTVNGLVPTTAPEYAVFGSMFRDSPEWGSAAALVPWMDWNWYGDRQTLDSAYDTMKAYDAYLQSRSKDGLLFYGLGDWYDIGPGEPGLSKLTPPGLTASATRFADLQALQQTARLLGHPSEADSFHDEAEHLRAAFQQEFHGAGSQTALAMPVALGLAPEPDRAALIEKLVADIRKHDNHTTAGDIGYHYVLSSLLKGGRSDVIFDMATRPDPPSYASQLAAGATSLTEAWDANPHHSQNHFMLGHIDEWFYAGLAGIQPDLDAPPLTRINIKPEPVGDLTWVMATWDSIRGPVGVSWAIHGSTLQLDVAIPPGLTAQIFAPAASRDQVNESAPEMKTVTFVRQETNRIVYRTGSGNFSITVRNFQRN